MGGQRHPRGLPRPLQRQRQRPRLRQRLRQHLQQHPRHPRRHPRCAPGPAHAPPQATRLHGASWRENVPASCVEGKKDAIRICQEGGGGCIVRILVHFLLPRCAPPRRGSEGTSSDDEWRYRRRWHNGDLLHPAPRGLGESHNTVGLCRGHDSSSECSCECSRRSSHGRACPQRCGSALSTGELRKGTRRLLGGCCDIGGVVPPPVGG